MTEVYERQAPDEQFNQPNNWPGDRLAKYLANATECFYYTYNAHRAQVKRFNAGLELFFEGSELLSRYRGRFAPDDEAMRGFDGARRFMLACRSELIAAATLIWSHQPYAASKQLRGALEAALYAHHVSVDPSAWDRWSGRPRADEPDGEPKRRARSNVGREFSATNLGRELQSSDKRLAKAVGHMYEELIDRGGHFNYPVYSGSTKRSEEGGKVIEWYTSIGATEAQIEKALSDINYVAALCLRVFDRIYREYWQLGGFSGKIGAFGFRVR